MQDQSLKAALEQHTKNAFALGIAAGRREVFDVAYAAVALIAERDALREALEKLVEAADASDECRYGTLATGFVRDMASAALAREQGVQS